jgi:RimJ/RimL family protein N-acetyltransferase
MRQIPLLRGLVQLGGHIIRRRNHVVFELDLTPPRAPVSWAPEERVIEIGPENIDTVMTPELLEFLGGDSVRKSLEGIRRGNRLIVVQDSEGYAAYGHVVINGAEYLRTLEESEPTPYLGNFLTVPRARRRGLLQKAGNECLLMLQRRGYRRVLAEARPTNTGSVKGMENQGMRRIRHLMGWIVFERLVIQRDIQNAGRWRVLLR